MTNLGDIAPAGPDWVARKIKKLEDEVRALRSARVGNTIQPVAFYQPDFSVAPPGSVSPVISAHIDVPAGGFNTAVVVLAAEWEGLRPAGGAGTYELQLQAYIGEAGEFSPSLLFEQFPAGDSPQHLSQTLATTADKSWFTPDLVVGALASATGPWDHCTAAVSGVVLFLR